MNAVKKGQKIFIILGFCQGWDEGVVGMTKGSKRFLVVPPLLAYGSKVYHLHNHQIMRSVHIFLV